MLVDDTAFYNKFAKLDRRDALEVLCMGVPSAVAAKLRLAAITRRDREACGDGRWVFARFDWDRGGSVYRWEPRR